ncbi:hypothetical protein GF324_08890 [bacterium]|nr:hypothetical protein [bacterium]
MTRNRFLIVLGILATLLFSFLTTSTGYAGKEEVEQRLEALKVELQSLAPGEPRIEMLRNVLTEKGHQKLGPWPVEAIVYEFLALDQADSALSYVQPLLKAGSTDHELKLILARMLFDRNPDQKQTFQLMKEAKSDLTKKRGMIPDNVYDDYWKFETRFMLAEIEHEMASLYYEKENLDDARSHILTAMDLRTRAKDLLFFGKLHMDILNYRNALGVFGYALYLESIPRAEELFRAAYDSMDWEPKLYDPYKERFLEEYHNQAYHQILSERRGPKVDDLPEFTVSNWIGPRGCAVVFWGDYVEVEYWPSLQQLANTFKKSGVPYRFIYVGENMDENHEEAKKRGYSFPGLTKASASILEEYKVEIDPTVIILNEEQRELMRVEGQNRDAANLFRDYWDAEVVTP